MILIRHKRLGFAILILLGICLIGGKNPVSVPTFFEKINSKNSGITSQNKVSENIRINLLTNEYTYMGGGVGAGDFNNDGLVDCVSGYYISNSVGTKELYPALNLDDVASQVPSIKKRYLLHKKFSTAIMQNIFQDIAGINSSAYRFSGLALFTRTHRLNND